LPADDRYEVHSPASYGSYFQLYKYDRISDEPDAAFAIRITRIRGGDHSGSVFYTAGKDDRVVRFALRKKKRRWKRRERLIKI